MPNFRPLLGRPEHIRCSHSELPFELQNRIIRVVNRFMKINYSRLPKPACSLPSVLKAATQFQFGTSNFDWSQWTNFVQKKDNEYTN